jgi:hypothetical protein
MDSLRAAISGALPTPRSYLVFGDIEGKLDVLRVECTKCDRKGPLSRLQADREIRAQWQHEEMAGTAQPPKRDVS